MSPCVRVGLGVLVGEGVLLAVGVKVLVGEGVLVSVGVGVSVSDTWSNGASLRTFAPVEGT